MVEPKPSPHALANLRRNLALADRQGSPSIPVGIPALDAALGGGIATGAVHEIAAARESEIPAATAFAAPLAAATRGPVVWISEEMALIESGIPYGPGLDEFGLAPERLIAVTVPKRSEVLWAMEEALRHRAGAVIAEVRGSLDPISSRRLSLAAGRGHSVAIVLRSTPDAGAGAAVTRFLVSAAPSGEPCSASAMRGPGFPRLDVQLMRNRRGALGAWVLEWNYVERRFCAPADCEPLAQTALHRPGEASLPRRGRVAPSEARRRVG
jgi:protein ImuA